MINTDDLKKWEWCIMMALLWCGFVAAVAAIYSVAYWVFKGVFWIFGVPNEM